eukprot:scaffold3543_cov61-Phaeocystis_antarctica.AAC.1
MGGAVAGAEREVELRVCVGGGGTNEIGQGMICATRGARQSATGRIRKASCRARRQAELPRLSARLARACASHSPRASRISARRLARRAASLIRGSLERASLPLDSVSLCASASTSARLR